MDSFVQQGQSSRLPSTLSACQLDMSNPSLFPHRVVHLQVSESEPSPEPAAEPESHSTSPEEAEPAPAPADTEESAAPSSSTAADTTPAVHEEAPEDKPVAEATEAEGQESAGTGEDTVVAGTSTEEPKKGLFGKIFGN